MLWEDEFNREVAELTVQETEGVLHFHNVWDSGKGRGPYESQRPVSGMVEHEGVYRCNDVGSDLEFDKVTFAVTINEPPVGA